MYSQRGLGALTMLDSPEASFWKCRMQDIFLLVGSKLKREAARGVRKFFSQPMFLQKRRWAPGRVSGCHQGTREVYFARP